MGFRVYAKAGTMRVNPFRGCDIDTVQVTLERVIYPRSFLSRLRTNPNAEFVSAECVIRNRAESIPLRFEDLVAFHFPIGTVGVNLRFKPRYSFGDSLLSIKTQLITDDIEDIEIVGKREVVVDLLEWLHVPLSEFRLK